MNSPNKKWVGLNSFTAVGAGQVAVLDIDTKNTIHTIEISYKASGSYANQATIEADIEEIRLVVNGTVQRTFSAAELLVINAFHGMDFTDGFLSIYFAEQWRTNELDQDLFAWGMGDVDSFQVEVDIAAGAVSPQLTAKAEITRDVRNMGPIAKWKAHTVPVTATGDVEWYPLKDDSYVALHCKSTDIVNFRVQIDEDDELRLTDRENDKLLADRGWSTQAGYTHIKFDYTGRATNILPVRYPKTHARVGQTVDKFDVLFNMSAATSFRVIREVVGLRD